MENVIIALDFENEARVISFLDQFSEPLFVKVGMELYYQTGSSIIKTIKQRGHRIFLDLKCHDIPNTVEKTMRGLAKLDVDLVNCHASGGKRMMEAALRGLEAGKVGDDRPLLIAVTQLTSTSQEEMNHDQQIPGSLQESVVHYAQLTKEAGLDGVVCSPLESVMIHEACGDSFLTITPGVRLSDSKQDDQKRVTTPADAKQLGSNFIVVGRPITEAQNPVEAYRSIVKEFKK
ncbi:orotidine 5'-phosphate decarboxylase [Erysipelothrix larvae]|uniref:Orotidine 5'-phosphate decarboxylase n=1 Tax=Erysipelothrix larvae TaxID=1514105 RepID=A0A120JTY8_9FIRM|nr:orotidine-5'-phosphate decarboxylase [Erysipelothrix larvae]AMC94335.1 orotidine 5'-phosphate decarboxylase [Erysipelothrix larvae]